METWLLWRLKRKMRRGGGERGGGREKGCRGVGQSKLAMLTHMRRVNSDRRLTNYGGYSYNS